MTRGPVPPPEAPFTTEARLAASERERWLRERFEREHEFTLALMRLLVEGLTRESRAMRFWRWLIDDFRSERRITADLDGLSVRLHDALGARFAVTRLEPGSLPVAEHKTRIVHRTARGDELPPAIGAIRRG